MTHPLADMPDRPPGRGPSGTAATGEPSLSMQQRTVLERLITRLVALTSQQNAEVWACVKHDLGLKGDTPLLARHFSAAEASLNQRLATAQDNHHHRQTLAQLSDLLGQGNNRQAVSDYIRQHYGQTALHALSQTQLEHILHLLQRGQLSIPQPQQRPPTLRPLLPAEHNTLNQLVTKLAAATGEPSKLIWQSMLELCGVKSGELIPATHFTPLSYWLQARQTLSAQTAPTLTSLQGALKQPLEAAEWQKIVDFARRNWQVTPQTTLSPAQILALLNKAFVLRVARAQETLAIPQEEPVTRRTWAAKPWQLALGAVVLLLVLWLLL
ncbi:flagella biosynthesis regulator Flk [Klebsiella pneumoniae]|uniref:flagella biosynthesis regulator Flk n=1 Tax=Klebsiella pneumoniae TaxID=573 RepID=UPI0024A87868|nr:flagella biosynthesis regulator Flk [Klebsiella pneumoniae]HBW3428855.1 flagella biosynthesis regulator Flk [Klebsiella pneumoniae]HBX7609179.1 flagella biosynthesis regulator Flk [Klebsiella pneumoniae]HBX7625860.1 flagella biosynthesis regulator Flk [Klebsiella pneumoniae]HBZ2320492.1 flagella biosynthesis regulator Flk [Klebsiella pneumoniae]HBZ2461329.1 flagella biosynthesis regulator Flk [Klebsiella pneumoniae]